MFKRVFSSRKKGTDVVSALEKLKQTIQMLELKEEVLLKKVATEVKRAIEFSKSKNKRAAISCLKRKKLYDSQVERIANFKLRLQDQMIMLEDATLTTEAVEALRSSSSAIKGMHKAANIGDVSKTMDEVCDQLDDMKQIQEALSSFGGATYFDEDDLATYFKELDEAEFMPSPLRSPSFPHGDRYFTMQPTGYAYSPELDNDDLDELAAMQAEMEL